MQRKNNTSMIDLNDAYCMLWKNELSCKKRRVDEKSDSVDEATEYINEHIKRIREEINTSEEVILQLEQRAHRTSIRILRLP